jgi:uncharacterized protein
MPSSFAPGIFVDEVLRSPTGVTEVETARAAFIGHTAQAKRAVAGDLHLRPTPISSLAEFQRLFGGPHTPDIHITLTSQAGGLAAAVVAAASYVLFDALKLYFANGGQRAVVVSVGSYTEAIELTTLSAGLDVLAAQEGPSLLVCPEAVRLSPDDYGTLVQAMLLQCSVVKNRFAVIDFLGGHAWPDAPTLQAHRALLGSQQLMHGAAYYPSVCSSDTLAVKRDKSNVMVSMDAAAPVPLGTLSRSRRAALRAAYQAAQAALLATRVVVPPGGAVAGVFARTDVQRGVWKAPANEALVAVLRPQVVMTDAQQELLSRDDSGKGINAIRSFTGRGTLVWGARTLAGNDNEWRYVPVRRFFNMVEASIVASTAWVVWEAHDAITWARLRTMVENYLVLKWRDGALAGAKPEHAFFVQCDLGSSMTEADIQAGRLVMRIGMAALRPAEFIVLSLTWQMQRG